MCTASRLVASTNVQYYGWIRGCIYVHVDRIIGDTIVVLLIALGNVSFLMIAPGGK